MELGKLPAVRPHNIKDMSVYVDLPPAKPAVAPPEIKCWKMLGNDQVGDCTIAGAAHLLMAWDKDYSEDEAAINTAEVESQYFALTGGADTGLIENDVLKTWRSAGLFSGNKIALYAPVTGIGSIHQVVEHFGGCYLGVQLPASAETQFRAGQPWTVEPDDQIIGGHCVVAVGYDPHVVTVVTWGQLQQVTYPWLARYCDESWGILSSEQAERSGANVSRFERDLELISRAN
jgi:hypothetical protein